MTVNEHMAQNEVNVPAPRPEQSHKGDYGHVYVIGGSPGMTGAVRMAARSVQLAGAGLVTMGLPAGLNMTGEVGQASVMSLPLPDTPDNRLGLRAGLRVLELAGKCDVCGLGPGLGRAPATAAMVRRLVTDLSIPLVLDADGLNAIAGQDGIVRGRVGTTVLTPHPGEMARLVGCSVGEVQDQREAVALDCAQGMGAVVVLKGHRTVVAEGDRTWINHTGNPGMATGGMGDVLTGLIAGLIGQGMSAWDAARLAVSVHGRAGDIAVERTGQLSLTPESLMDCVPEAWDDPEVGR